MNMRKSAFNSKVLEMRENLSLLKEKKIMHNQNDNLISILNTIDFYSGCCAIEQGVSYFCFEDSLDS